MRLINFEAAVAAAKYRSGEYLGGHSVSKRRSLERLLHHSFWSRGEGKSMYPTRAEISLSRVLSDLEILRGIHDCQRFYEKELVLMSVDYEVVFSDNMVMISLYLLLPMIEI